MFHHNNQLCTPSFPIGLVKTEFDFIVRSVKADLGRWTPMVAMIAVDANAFSNLQKFIKKLIHINEMVFTEISKYHQIPIP